MTGFPVSHAAAYHVGAVGSALTGMMVGVGRRSVCVHGKMREVRIGSSMLNAEQN